MDHLNEVLAQLAAGAIIAYFGAKLFVLICDWWEGLAPAGPAPVDPVQVQVWEVLAAADAITRQAADAAD